MLNAHYHKTQAQKAQKTRIAFLKCQDLEYIRVLGFNDKGQMFINKNKKKCDLPIISNFSKNKSIMMEQEFIATLVYASILDEKRKKELIEKEYKYHPKYKEKMNNE